MLHSVSMKDFMSINPVTFRPDTDIFEALHVILEREITGATVVDEDNQVVGVVSEMDLLKAFEEISYYNEGTGTVDQFMVTKVETIDLRLNIFDAAKRLRELKRRRMPVVENGKFVGEVSARSLLQKLKDSMCGHDKTEDSLYL